MKILLVLLILSLSMNTISASIDMDDCDEMGLNKYQILEVVNRFETSEDKVNLRTRYQFVGGAYHTIGCHYFFSGEAKVIQEAEVVGEAKVAGEAKVTGEVNLDRIVHVRAAYVISKAGEVVSVSLHHSYNCVVKGADTKGADLEEMQLWLNAARMRHKNVPEKPVAVHRVRVDKMGCVLVYWEYLRKGHQQKNVFTFDYQGELVRASLHR